MEGHRLRGTISAWDNTTLKEAVRKLESNQQYGQEIRKERIMSTALWCDKGDHAFSAKDSDKQHFTQTRTVRVETGNSYGHTTYQDQREITEELDICGPCWSKTNPFSPDSSAAKKPAIALVKDDNDDYLRGYRDGEMNR